MRPTRCRLRHSRNQVHALRACVSYTKSLRGFRCCCRTCRQRRCGYKLVIAALVVLAVNMSCRARRCRRCRCLRRQCRLLMLLLLPFTSARAARAASSPVCLPHAHIWHAAHGQPPGARATNNTDYLNCRRFVYMRGEHPSLRKGQ